MEKHMTQIKNPLAFEDETVLKRTNILNELLLGQDMEIVQNYLEQCGLEGFGCDIRHFHLLLTGMRRDMYIRKGTTPYKNLKMNRCFAEQIIAVLRGMANEAVSMYGLKGQEIETAKGLKEYHSVSAMMADVATMCESCAKLARNVRQRYSLPTIKALQYISANYQKAITQGEIAAYIGVSAQYLSSLFNSEMHMSIPEYIRQLRFEEIKRELRQTNRPASRIARDNGYQNLSYFKKAEGCTAAEYRERELGREE